jgi:hypothetical protein
MGAVEFEAISASVTLDMTLEIPIATLFPSTKINASTINPKLLKGTSCAQSDSSSRS